MQERTTRTTCRRVALVALVAVVAGCSYEDGARRAGPEAVPSPSAVAAREGELAWAPCEDGFSCAPLEVPLVADDPAQGSVELAVTRLPAADPENRIGTLVVNPGGPGVSAVDWLQSSWWQVLPVVRERFDLVAFDPRGVGRSEPVRCGTTEELDRYFALDPSPESASELVRLERANGELAASCARRSGPVLAHMSTAQAAADLERLRVALGEEQLTYLGYSYGTAIGTAYLDRFPTRVRAMLLDGALPPTLTWDELLAGQARGFDAALEAFLVECESSGCAYREQVEGDLGEAYDRLVARVDAAPLPGDGERSLGPGELSLGVGAALYSPEDGWPALAAALVAAERGDGAPLLALSDSYLGRGPDGYTNANEANLAVNCTDRPWPDQTGAYVALAERLERDAPRFGQALALSGLACAAWPVEEVHEPHEVRAEGAPPVVVVGTTGDPATPYAWSVALADQLRSAVLVTHEGEGHTVYGVEAPSCLLDPLDDYLLTGRLPEPSTC